jgi:hypothetical protein
MDLDAGFAWLESLAARQGATEALFVAPEDRRDEAPDWVAAAAQEAQVEAEPLAPAELPPQEVITEQAEPADLLAETATSTEISAVEMQPEVETPQVTLAVDELEGAAEAAAAIADSGALATEVEAAQPLEAAIGVEAQAEVAAETPELPDWLAGIEAQPTLEEPSWSPPSTEAPLEEASPELLEAQPAAPVESFAAIEPAVAATGDQSELILARNALARSAPAQAVQHYSALIKSRQYLAEVAQDLNEALYRHPVDISIWQTLGDAYMRLGQLQAALDAYTKAEELLR